MKVELSETMLAALRELRRTARCHANTQDTADRIVERTLDAAAAQAESKPKDQPLMEWLEEIMTRSLD